MTLRRAAIVAVSGLAVLGLMGAQEVELPPEPAPVQAPPLVPAPAPQPSRDPVAEALSGQQPASPQAQAQQESEDEAAAPAEAVEVAEADISPAPDTSDDEDEAAEPAARTRHQAAVIQALDKITAETIRFEARVGRPVSYKGLIFTLRACESTAADEPVNDAAAFLEISSQPREVSGRRPAPRQVFRGWMFAQAPAVNPLRHPVYDAWVISCRDARPSAPRG
ncbi:DUF2155 domain-containing protein [Brevundimonas sp. 2R-24]|uniref:DUF2155 domain-containing protein n=1 Tax=Peiella sedimenti TaxID=3061083 RepID=A0ABT8SJT7_9CAUL|nr:DUF2155 domain-containing protein [Caulobacteraceae bacterium XZ-24]